MKLEPNTTHIVDFAGFRESLSDQVAMYSLYSIRKNLEFRNSVKVEYLEIFSSHSVMELVDYMLANGYNLDNVEFSPVSEMMHENEMILEISDLMKNDSKDKLKDMSGDE